MPRYRDLPKVTRAVAILMNNEIATGIYGDKKPEDRALFTKIEEMIEGWFDACQRKFKAK
jgi:hypothetical protein